MTQGSRLQALISNRQHPAALDPLEIDDAIAVEAIALAEEILHDDEAEQEAADIAAADLYASCGETWDEAIAATEFEEADMEYVDFTRIAENRINGHLRQYLADDGRDEDSVSERASLQDAYWK